MTRATLAGFFLPNAVMVLAGQIAGGLWDEQTLRRLSLALPGVLAATWLGGRLNRRVPAARFQRLLYGLLIVMGALLLQASAA